jgi:hypothetical protein
MQKISLIAVAIIVTLTGGVAQAQEQTPLILDDAQISHIRTRCVDVQSFLSRLRANDGLRRVNLGQQYETISTRLMAPMNSRIALNKLDGVDLTKTAVDFNTQLDVFRESYREYEKAITTTIDMKCKDQPVTFYDSVMAARAKRVVLKESMAELSVLLQRYSTQFNQFSQTTLQKSGESQ